MSQTSIKNEFYHNPYFWFYLSDEDFILYARENVIRYTVTMYLPPEYNEVVIINLINEFATQKYSRDSTLNNWIKEIIDVDKHIKNIKYKEIEVNYIENALWMDFYFFLLRLRLGRYRYDFYDLRVKNKEVNLTKMLKNVFDYNVSAEKLYQELSKMDYFFFLSQRTNIKHITYEFNDRIEDKNLSYTATRDFIILIIKQVLHYVDLYDSKNDRIYISSDFSLFKIKKATLLDSLEIIKVLLNVIHLIAISDNESLTALRNKMMFTLKKIEIPKTLTITNIDSENNILKNLEEKNELLYYLLYGIYNSKNKISYEEVFEKEVSKICISHDITPINISNNSFKEIMLFYNTAFHKICRNKFRAELTDIIISNFDRKKYLNELSLKYHKLYLSEKRNYFVMLNELRKNEKLQRDLQNKFNIVKQSIEKKILILTSYIFNELNKTSKFNPASYIPIDQAIIIENKNNIWNELEDKYFYQKYDKNAYKDYKKDKENYNRLSSFNRQGAPGIRKFHTNYIINDNSTNKIQEDNVSLNSLLDALNYSIKKHDRIVKSRQGELLAKIAVKKMPKHFLWSLKFEIFNSLLLFENNDDYSIIELLGYLLANKIHPFLENNYVFYENDEKLKNKIYEFCYNHIYDYLEICKKEYRSQVEEYKYKMMVKTRMEDAKNKQDFLKGKNLFLDRHMSKKQVRVLEIYNIISLNKYHELIFNFNKFQDSFLIDEQTIDLISIFDYYIRNQNYHPEIYLLHPFFHFVGNISEYLKSKFSMDLVKNNHFVYKSIEIIFYYIKIYYKKIPITEEQATNIFQNIRTTGFFNIRSDIIYKKHSQVEFSYTPLTTEERVDLEEDLYKRKNYIEALFNVRGIGEILLSEPYIIPYKIILLLTEGYKSVEHYYRINSQAIIENERYDIICKFFLSCLTEQITLYKQLVSETFKQSMSEIDDWNYKLNHYKKFPDLHELFRNRFNNSDNDYTPESSNINQIDNNSVKDKSEQTNVTLNNTTVSLNNIITKDEQPIINNMNNENSSKIEDKQQYNPNNNKETQTVLPEDDNKKVVGYNYENKLDINNISNDHHTTITEQTKNK